MPDFGGVDDAGCVWALAIIIVVVVAVGFVVFVLPAVIFIVDLLFLLVVAGLAVLARVLFRRPWIVVAGNDLYHYEWAVVGGRPVTPRSSC